MSDETENATKDDELPAWQQKQMRAAWEKWNSGAMNGGPATTPTAALVEEAEKWDRETPAGPWQFAHCGAHRESDKWLPCLGVRDESGKRVENIDRHMPAARRLIPDLAAALRRAEAERDELRATVTRLNRRAQTAEAGVRDNVEASKAAGKSMGRTLANAAAAMYLRRAEKAEAERDAQHAEVLRLTGERDEARLRLKASEEGLRVVTMERDHAQQVEAPDAFWQRDEARAQVWGLICAGSNMAERRRYFQGLWETLLADKLKRDAQLSELTVTRDLLTAENARLQKEVATLELLRRGGK